MKKSSLVSVVVFLALSAIFAASSAAADEGTRRLWIGTYTGKGENAAKGIYTCELNLTDGSLAKPVLAAECESPAFLAVVPSKPFLYAVGEIWGPYKNGGGPVYAFAADVKAGKLEHLNTEDVPGAGPCHLAVVYDEDDAGNRILRAVVTASYGGGSVSSLPILKDGKLGKVANTVKHEGKPGPNKQRQEAPHPHGVYYSPDDGTLAVPDLGLDGLHIYEIDMNSGKLSKPEGIEEAGEPLFHTGAGPRHLAIHPTHDLGVVVNELDSSVSVLAVEEPGDIPPHYSSLPEGVDPKSCNNSTAEIFFHPNGKFFYVSNRGHDSISVFSIDLEGDPRITPEVKLIQNIPCGGKTPRSFCVDPGGKFLVVANQESGNLCVFKIDENTGKLEMTEFTVIVPKPVCVIPHKQ